MYISAAGANSQSERLQVVTNNMANASTPGFKREIAIFQARHAEAIERGASPHTTTIDNLGGGVSMSETAIDFSIGTLKPTGNKADLAINGEGFFQVDAAGEQMLTRAGNFHVSAAGELLTQQGHRVLTEDGEPLVLNPNLDWQVEANGAISQAGQLQHLALVKPKSLGDLAKAGQNLFRPLADVEPIPLADRNVRGGHLELSSTNSTQEMMHLMESSRAYEANVKMIQNHDSIMGGLVSRLLRA